MKTFNKKALCAALAGLGVLGMAGAAQAVNLNPDGLGQALVYPYYTVRANTDGNAFDSMLTVVNTTSEGKAVKVRFLEGKASHEVLDFNLYLSPWDVWTGVVTPTVEGAKLLTHDTSCTWGNVRGATLSADGGREFFNILFSGDLADGEDDTLDRTREGYAEIIEMGQIINVAPYNILTAITHDRATGVPPNCDAIRDMGDEAIVADPWAVASIVYPSNPGGLFGNMTLINVNTARAVGFDAVALDGFYQGNDPWGLVGALEPRVDDTLWFPSGNMNPNLSMAWPPVSNVINGVMTYRTEFAGYPTATWLDHIRSDGKLVRTVYTPGLDAVSSVMMRSGIFNEYMNTDQVLGATDWVITLPTKGLYYDRAPDAGFGLVCPAGVTRCLQPRSLFQNTFMAGGAADVVTAKVYDREERTETRVGEGWSPSLPGIRGAYLRWEANVVEFKRAKQERTVFFSKNWNALETTPFDAGWVSITIGQVVPGNTVGGGARHVLTGDSILPSITGTNTFTGLPVVGFAATVYNNGAVNGAGLGSVWASYAATVPHRYQRTIANNP